MYARTHIATHTQALEDREAESGHSQTLQSTHNHDGQPPPAKASDPAGTSDLGEHHHVHKPSRPHQHDHDHGPKDDRTTSVSPTVVDADQEEEEDSEEELKISLRVMGDNVPGASYRHARTCTHTQLLTRIHTCSRLA